MFEDLEEESVDVTPDSPDRAIAWAIWARDEAASLTPDEGWAILHERYPEEPRFLLLNAYTELSETRKHSEGRIKAVRAAEGAATASAKAIELGAWSPAYFLKKLDRLASLAPPPLAPQVKDLLVFASALLTMAKGDEAKLLADLKTKLGVIGEPEPKRDDRDRAGLRIRRFEREVLKELDERTQENKPLGVRAPPPAAPSSSDWADAVADTTRARRRYAADGRFERGELVEHPKFGVGVVTGTEPGKAVILFESGVRKLVAAS